MQFGLRGFYFLVLLWFLWQHFIFQDLTFVSKKFEVLVTFDYGN